MGVGVAMRSDMRRVFSTGDGMIFATIAWMLCIANPMSSRDERYSPRMRQQRLD